MSGTASLLISLRPMYGTRSIRFSWAMIAVSVLASGCATVREPEPPTDPKAIWEQRQELLLPVQNWTVIGRIAINSEKDSVNASLNWNQQGDVYRIRLSTRMGHGLVEIAGGPAGVSMRTSDNQTYVAPDADKLLVDATGWRVPLAGLRHWILGRTDPDVPISTLTLDDLGRLDELEQSGWQIRYLRYQQVGDLELPTKVFLENAKLSTRVVVNSWELHS